MLLIKKSTNMKLSEFKNNLLQVAQINIVEPNGKLIPQHFHITEVGLITKHFIDCGATIRTEKVINFQVWLANDTEHRLTPKKLLGIISQSEPLFNNEDLEIEIEYQGETIGKYGLNKEGENFVLTNKETNCLAQDHCGIPKEKMKVNLRELQPQATACCSTSTGSCC